MSKTILELLEETVKTYGDHPYLYEARKGFNYTSLTYKEVQERAKQLAAGLMKLGLQPGDRVALMSEGKNNWVIGELGILHAGGVCVPLSVKLETEQDITFRINHSGCSMVLASDQQIIKLRPLKDRLTSVKHYILLDPDAHPDPDEIKIDSVIENGRDFIASFPDPPAERIKTITPDTLANISYTSGTTANPKGIMLSHGNYVCNAGQAVEHLNGLPSYFHTLLILPWDHSFGHTAGIYAFMKCGASIAAVAAGKTPMEILRNIPGSMEAVNPHILMSVPALAANFRKSIEAGIQKKGKRTEQLFRKALKLAYDYNKEGFNKGAGAPFWQKALLALYDRLIFSKIRASFAGNLQYFIGGGALLDIELQRFFYAIGIPMYQGYGLSEASPIISANTPHAHKLGSSGKPLPHMDIRIVDDSLKEVSNGEKGEIVVRGGNVMKGYWKNPEATDETIVDGWLRTGDMGYIDQDGYLYVLGRTKSLLISNDGEKFSPEGIEEAIMAKSPYIDQCVLYNNQRPYTTALIVANANTLKRRTADPREAVHIIENEISAYLKGGKYDGEFPYRWLPSAFAVLEEPFTERNGMVNSTMKIVKHKVYDRYAGRIEELYTPEGKKAASENNIRILERLLR